MKNKKTLNITLSVILGLAFTLMILTFAIAIPLFDRNFFFSQINLLNLVSKSHQYGGSYTYLDIKVAYNEIMDSLMFFYPFSEGNFPYTESAMEHFMDCRKLFLLNNITLLVSFIVFIALMILKHKKKFEMVYFKGFSTLSIGPMILVLIIIIGAIRGLIDFYSLFIFFHAVFFPGKTNFYFDEILDPIILVFDEQFFANCAILIGVVFLILASIPFIKDIFKIRKRKQIKENLQDNK